MKQPVVSSITPNLSTIDEGDVGTDSFYLTITFSEAMDTGTDPTISFPTAGEDPTSGGTLTANSSSWSSNTTFVQYYDVADHNLEMSNIDVQVSGAKDAAGNTMTAWTASNTFSVDMRQPVVSSITPSSATINEGDAGANGFSITITFDEAMDTGTNPTISFPTVGEDPTSDGTLAAGSSNWSDNTTFVQNYTVTDNNLEMSDIDVRVSGAKDAAGNTMTAWTASNTFSVDMKQPVVSSLTTSSATINESTSSFSITVIFNEPMDTGTNPTIDFPTVGEDPTSDGTLAAGAGSWTGSTTFTRNYTITDNDLEMSDIDVRVSGAQDLAGNTMTAWTASNTFSVDMKAPTTPTLVINGGNYVNLSNYTNVSLEITGEAGTTYNYVITTDGGSGSVSGNGTMTSSSTTVTGIDLSSVQDGTLTASATLTDHAGNVSSAGTDTETKDTQRPSITSITAEGGNGSQDGTKKIGDAVTFKVQFSEDVTITGTPRIQMSLTSSTATRYATYSSMSGTDAAIFSYTVQEDDAASDLTHIDGDLDLNGGSVKDDADNSATLTLPSASVFQGANAIEVDGVKPRITIQYYSNPGLSLALADDFIFSTNPAQNSAYLKIASDEPLAGRPALVVDAQGSLNDINASGSSIDSVNNQTYYYHRTITTDTGTDGTVRETITVTATDLAGNEVVATVANQYISSSIHKEAFIDCTPPSFTMSYYSDASLTTSLGDNPKLKAGTYYIKIWASESLSGSPTVTIDAEGSNNDISDDGTSSMGGNVYRLTRTIASDAQAIGVTLEDISITGQDGNGNNATNVDPTNESSKAAYTDTKPPTISSNVITTPNNSTYWNQGNHDIVWNTSGITDEGGLSANSLTFNYWDGSSWNSLAANEANDGSYTWNVPNINVYDAKIRVAASDEAGNSSTWTESQEFAIDNTPPVISNIADDADYVKQGDVVQITFDVEEIGALSNNPTVSIWQAGVSDNHIGDATFVSRSGSGTSADPYSFTYNYTVGTGDYGVRIEVDATDDAGNDATTGVEDNAFTIDNTPPAAFTVGSVTSTGGTVVANYWNSTNTGLNVTVPIANDASLNGGTVQVIASKDNWTSQVNLGSSSAIASGDLGTNKTLSFTAAEFEGLSGFGDGDDWKFKAIITDYAGNQTTGSESSDDIQVDQTAPTLSPVTIASDNANTDAAKSGDVVTVTMTSNETLSGITVNSMQSGGSAVSNAVSTANPAGNQWTASYTVSGTDADGSVSFNITATDVAGNTTDVTSTSDGSSVTVDNTAPAAFTVGSVTSTGGTVVANYWNSTNTGLNVTVPIANDASLNGGTVQVIASKDNWTSQVNLGSSSAIASGDLGTNKTLSFTAAEFEGLSGFGDGDDWKFKAIITDYAGNQTTGSESSDDIQVDQTAPSATSVSISSNNGNDATMAKAGDVVTVEVTSNETLSGIQNIAFTSGGSAVNNAGSATDNGGNQWDVYYTVSLSDQDGNVGFSFELMDLAGNTTNVNSVTDGSSVTVDNTAPVISNIADDADYVKQGDNVQITFEVQEDGGLSSNPTVTIKDQTAATTIGTANYVSKSVSGSSYTFTYNYAVGTGDYENVRIEVDATDDAGNDAATGVKTAAFTIDNTAPVISITSPAAGTKVNSNPIAFTITESHQNSTTGSADGTTYVAFSSGNAANTLGGWAGVGEGNFTATIKHEDLAGNVGSATISLVKDVTSPSATSIATAVADGCYNSGDVIDITLTFDENVWVSGAPRLSLNTTPAAYADYYSGDGTNQLTFRYTVGSSENVGDLDATSIDLNGGSIKDQALNDVADGTDITSLGFDDNHDIKIDNTNPTVTSRTPADNATGVSLNQTLSLQFSETVSLVSGKHVTIFYDNSYGNNFETFTIPSSNVTLVGGTTLQIDPSSDFECGTTYNVVLDNGIVEDCAGNPYSGNDDLTTWNFDTKNLPTVKNVSSPTAPNCSGDDVTITVVSSESGVSYEVYKNGTATGVTGVGDGSDLDLTVNSATSGTYTVKGSNGSCQTDMNGTVVVNDIPNASLTANDNSVCQGDEVTFTASPTGQDNYEFKVNGSTVQNGSDPVFKTTTLNNGDYVSVIVTKGGCSDASNTITMTVYALPSVSVSSDDADNAICEGDNVTFTATAGLSNYKFYVNSSLEQNGTANTFSTTTLSDGDKVWVEATNANGCSDVSNTVTMTVSAYPVAGISSDDPDNSICDGTNVTFTATPSGMANYKFYVNSSLEQNGTSDTYSTATLSDGDKIWVVVTNATGCSDVSSTITMEVIYTPDAAGAISGSSTVARGDNGVGYSVGTINHAATYEWSYTGTGVTINGNNTSSNSVTIDFASNATSGNLTVRGVNSCGQGAWSAAFAIDVQYAPIISGAPSDATVCEGSSATFSVTSVDANPAATLTWQESTDGSTWNDVSGANYTTLNGGLTLQINDVTGMNGYQYRLKASNAQGTTYSGSATLNVTTPVTPGVSISITSGSNPTCLGANVTFTASPVNGGASPSYQWKVNGGDVGSDNSSYSTTTLSDGDKVWVIMTTSETCVTTSTANSNTITIQVDDPPTYASQPSDATISSHGSATFTATVNGKLPMTYQWQYSSDGGTNWSNVSDGGIYSGATTDKLVLTDVTTTYNGYKYKLLSSNDCQSNVASNVATLTVNPGPEKFAITSALPSPTVSSSSFTLTIQSQDNGGTPRDLPEDTPIHITASGTNFDYVEILSTDTVMDAGTNTININVKLHSTDSDKDGATGVTITADNDGGTNLTAATTAAFTLLAIEPTAQSYNIQWSGRGQTSINYNYTAGNGQGTLVLVKQNATSISDVPSDGQGYTANSVYASGDNIGTSYVVYDGTSQYLSVTGLSSNTRYCFRLFAYNGSGATRNYSVATDRTYVQRSTFTLLKKGEKGEENPNLSRSIIGALDFTPQPAKDKLTIDLTLNVEVPVTITIHNLAGAEITKPLNAKKLSAGKHTITVDIDKLNVASGTYMIVVGAGEEVVIDRIMIVK